jgi:Ribosomal protein S7e
MYVMTAVIYFEIVTNSTFRYLYSQVDISGNRKAVVIHVPYRLRKGFKKIHVRLVRELEKKFSGKVSWSFT